MRETITIYRTPAVEKELQRKWNTWEKIGESDDGNYLIMKFREKIYHIPILSKRDFIVQLYGLP